MSASPSSEEGATRSSPDGRGRSIPPDREEEFDEESAGGVVVRRIEDRPNVLLILDPYGKWGLPKGHLEGDEAPTEAAAREVREETGLDDVDVGPEVDTVTWSFYRKGRRIRKICTFYLMWSFQGSVRPEVSEGISDCEWLPMDKAVGRVGYENARDVLRKADRMIRDEATAEALPGDPGTGR